MKQEGIVSRIIDNDTAEVLISRQSACGHDCASCGGGCTENMQIKTKALNPIGAETGNIVMVESSTSSILGFAFVVYIIPIVFFIAGYGITSLLNAPEWCCILVSVAAFLLGLVPSKLLNRAVSKKKSDCTIVSVLRP